MRYVNLRSRRGVAMLLILVSVMVATVLTSAYMASRDNSAAIGENVAEAAAARWAAAAGLELGLATLQTETDWRMMHQSGWLLRNHPIDNALLSLKVRDIATDGPPNENSEHIELVAIAAVDGVRQEVTASVYVPVSTNHAADVDLSEFAIFAADEIRLTDDAVVTRWPKSPLSTLGRPVALGTRAISSSRVLIDGNALVVDGKVYVRPDASNLLVSIANGLSITTTQLPDTLPWPAPPPTDAAPPSVLTPNPDLIWTSGSGNINTTRRGGSITISAGARRTLQGNISLIADGKLEIADSKLVIDGDVKIIAFDDIRLENAAIELREDARLTLFVGDAFDMRDSYIGDLRTTNTRDNTGSASTMDLERIKLFRIAPVGNSANWTIDGNSVVKGNVYAPLTRFELKDQSALYGRVAAQEVRIRGAGALFYDHRLDDRTGFTAFSGPLYKEDGTLKDAFRSLASLDDSALLTAAELTGTLVRSVLDRDVKIEPSTNDFATPSDPDPSDPTPRPVQIEYELVSHGTSVTAWEGSADALH